MNLYNKHVKSFYVKEALYDNKSNIGFVDEIRVIHESLLGTELKPNEQEYYLQLGSSEAVALHILSLPELQNKIKNHNIYWEKDQWVMGVFRNLKVWLNLRDRFISYGVLQGNWDNKQVDHMLSIIKKGDVIVDIGANIGVYALQAAQVVGNTGKIICFEPNKSIIPFLKQSIQDNGFENISTVHQMALGDIKGKARFVLCNDETNPGASYVTTNSTMGHYNVPLATLDSLKLDKVDFIKLDAQGNELKVLEGAKKTIVNQKPTLLVDINQTALKDIGKTTLKNIINFLINLQYKVEVYSGNNQYIIFDRSEMIYDEFESQICIVAQAQEN